MDSNVLRIAKECLVCNKPFYKLTNHSKAGWDNRKYCSTDCYYKTIQKENHHNWQGGGNRQRRHHLQKAYGLSWQEFQDMYNAQEGLCAICSDREATCVDHDHVTHKIRALLCRKCNAAIGIIGEQPDVLQKAANYLRSYNGD